ncbi:glycoside hydrolase family protein [Acetobacteraceae bacterium KSS8]|uniref:Lysozyme n=1 Tax=Endosaccharibacter trunci TaxID=2812733 RepID=A0ABT1WBN6_9PROT|nr:glycoside hydrolase family protein [Acetobacteraceae bacterium KSS8]
MSATTGYDPAALRVLLTRQEGNRSVMYTDTTGNKTVGIGHNMSIAQSAFVIDALYSCDVTGSEKSLDAHLPWWRSLDPVRQAALMDLMFNMGWGSLGTFTNTLRAFSQGNYDAAANGLLNSLWARQVGHDRSTDLAGMVRTGAMPDWMQS